VDGTHYMPHITSYDYDCPISEGGGYGQPGIGGDSKYHVSECSTDRLQESSTHKCLHLQSLAEAGTLCWSVVRVSEVCSLRVGMDRLYTHMSELGCAPWRRR